MHLLNMFSLKTINKIVQSGNIAHPLTLCICPFECFQYILMGIYFNCVYELLKRSFVSCIIRSFVSCIVRSNFASCVRLIRLTNETNDTRNERTNYTNEAQNERKTKNEGTIHANETNKNRKRNEISVNLNDPGSVTT